MKNHNKINAKDDLSKARTPKEVSENTGIKKHLKKLSPEALTILVKAAHRELMKKNP